MALQIIRHAFRMIFGNLGQVLRVSVGPFALLILAIVVGFAVVNSGIRIDPETGLIDLSQLPFANLGTVSFVVLLLVAFGLIVFAWIAVSWHRFILLEEHCGVIPAMAGRPILSYVWVSLGYVLVVFAVAIPITIILGLILIPLINAGAIGPLSEWFINVVVVGGIIGWFWLRIALALPSVAIGNPITMSHAWSASSRMSGTIFGVAIIVALINATATWLAQFALNEFQLVGSLIDLAIQWLTLMLSISVLTTLYGHLIEKRPLIE